MKKLILLSLCFTLLCIDSIGQISFDTTYHENLNVDSSEFDYSYDYYITNNALDPADTMFTWEVTYVDKEDSWDHMVLLPEYCGFINPTRPYNFKLGKDANTFLRLAFWLYSKSGEGTMTVTISSVLHPEIRDSITLKINVRSLVTVQNTAKLDFSAYPNPAQDYITIESEPGTIYSFSNIKGQFIKEGTLDNQNNKIDITELLEGTYFLKVQNEGSVGVRKVMIGSR